MKKPAHKKSTDLCQYFPVWYNEKPASVLPVADTELVEWLWEGMNPSWDDTAPPDKANESSYPDGYVEGVRLSEELTEPFRRYMEEFIRFFPKNCFHIKREYDGGWPQPKVKKGARAGKPSVLVDDGDFRYLTETVERHLNYRQWAEWKDRGAILPRQDTLPQFWLALNAPKYVNHENIDIDSKQVLGYYHDQWDRTGTLRPVMYLPLAHFQKIKAIYDAFPGRIWCISSESLGLHVWQWYENILPIQQRRQPILDRLEAIGYRGTEVHPMPGRPQRRPFGKDYRTITADRILTNWVDQLEYFEKPGPAPSFRRIATVLLDAMFVQWRFWLERGEAKANNVYPRHVLREYILEVKAVKEWLTSGCPSDLKVCLAATAQRSSAAMRPSKRKNEKSISAPTCEINVDAICKGGQWVQYCEEWARNGLPVADSVYQVCTELAKWLYWIELYHAPAEDRKEKVQKLLVQFVKNKHNGHCDRLLNGDTKSVQKQITRTVQEVIDHGDTKPWKDIRNKRTTGKYRHLIYLAPLMAGVKPGVIENQREKHGSVSSVGGLTGFSDQELPVQVIAMIQKKAGRNKLIPFATKFLNYLHEHGGRYCVSRERLMEMLGYTDPPRVTKYRNILVKAGVIFKGGYRAHVRATEYTLLVKAEFDLSRGEGIAQSS